MFFSLFSYITDLYILYRLISFYKFTDSIVIKLIIALIAVFLFQGAKNFISGLISIIVTPLISIVSGNSYQLFRFFNGFITYGCFYFFFFKIFKESFSTIENSFFLQMSISLIATLGYENAFYRSKNRN